MSRWDGFNTVALCPLDGRAHIRVVADYGGTDEDPVPMALIIRGSNFVELTEDELQWLAEVAPPILERMKQRP